MVSKTTRKPATCLDFSLLTEKFPIQRTTQNKSISRSVISMSSFIKFFDSKGVLVALTSLDGIIKYTTAAGKNTFQHLSPTEIIGQNISLVLKDPHMIDLFSDRSFPRHKFQSVELHTVHNTSLTARVSPASARGHVDSAAAKDASLEHYACEAPPSSLAKAFRSQPIQFHDATDDNSQGHDEQELSFNECFDNAAVEYS